MKELITFMYTDECSDDNVMDSMAEALLIAASKYQVIGMMNTCEDYLTQQISNETAIPILRFSDMYCAIKLKEDVLHFIAQNNETIVQGKEYAELDGVLKQEVTAAIEAAAKRKGCRNTGETSSGERRFLTSCVIL
jgi:hypothetical protein